MESWREELYHSKKGEERKGHKYISREWKNGKWIYYYTIPSNNSGSTKIKSNLLTRISDFVGFDELTNLKDKEDTLYKRAADINRKKVDNALQNPGKTTSDLAKENIADLKKKARQRNTSETVGKVFKRPMPDHLKPSGSLAPIHQDGQGDITIADYSKPKPTYVYTNNSPQHAVSEYLKAKKEYAKTPLGKIDKSIVTFEAAVSFVGSLFKKKKKG